MDVSSNVINANKYNKDKLEEEVDANYCRLILGNCKELFLITNVLFPSDVHLVDLNDRLDKA